MKIESALALLRLKAMAIDKLSGNAQASAFFEPILLEFERGSGKSTTDLEDWDSMLTQMLRSAYPRAQLREIEAALRQQFGCAHLSESPEKVVKQVLKRGRIRNAKEAQVIRDLLADGREHFDEPTLLALDAHFTRFEMEAAK